MDYDRFVRLVNGGGNPDSDILDINTISDKDASKIVDSESDVDSKDIEEFAEKFSKYVGAEEVLNDDDESSNVDEKSSNIEDKNQNEDFIGSDEEPVEDIVEDALQEEDSPIGDLERDDNILGEGEDILEEDAVRNISDNEETLGDESSVVDITDTSKFYEDSSKKNYKKKLNSAISELSNEEAIIDKLNKTAQTINEYL